MTNYLFGSLEYLAFTPKAGSMFGGYYSNVVAVDYAAGQGYILGSSPNGLAIFDVSTMDGHTEKAMTAILTAGDSGGSNFEYMINGLDNALYFLPSNRIVRVDKTTLTETAEFPTTFNSGGFGSTTFFGCFWQAPLRFFDSGGTPHDFLVCGDRGLFAAWGVLALPGMTHVTNGHTSGIVTANTPGRVATNYGEVWFLTGPGLTVGSSLYIDRVSTTDGITFSFANVKTFAASEINPAATQFLAQIQPVFVYDATTNSLAFICNTTIDGTTSAGIYLVGWSEASGILWKTLLPLLTASLTMGLSNADSGTLAIFLITSGGGSAVEVDIRNGFLAFNQDTWPIGMLNSAQIYDSQTQSVLGFFGDLAAPGWARTVPLPPPPLNPDLVVAELWFGETAGFVDMTVESNRRKFICVVGGAADLGVNGEAPFGGAPVVYLSRRGLAATFAQNNGRGGAFTITGGTLTDPGTEPAACGSVSTVLQPNELGQGVLGDYRNGNLYAFNAATLTDNGTPRKWVRRWRALPQGSMMAVKFGSLAINVQTGLGVPTDANPQLVLRWSDDGGASWSDERKLAAGKTGQTTRVIKFNRLGMTRRNLGADRIFELSSTDPFLAAIIDAEVDAS